MADQITEYSVPRFAQIDRPIYLQHHQPKSAVEPFHFHPSIEFFHLEDCELTSSFSGQNVTFKDGHFGVFWAAFPHRALQVSGSGTMVIAYVSLREFNSWKLPQEFVSTLLGGAVLQSKSSMSRNGSIMERWSKEVHIEEKMLSYIHCLEANSLIRRMVVDGYDQLLEARTNMLPDNSILHSYAQFEKMMRFISMNFSQQISVEDVAKVGELRKPAALKLFRTMIGRTIKEHLVDVRLAHAKMLLSQTDRKVLTIAMDSGFNNLSSFYKSFRVNLSTTPAAFRCNEQEHDGTNKET